MNESIQKLININSCGVGNDHLGEWRVTMTSPRGTTGVPLVKCTECLIKLLNTSAVQTHGRVANVSVA